MKRFKPFTKTVVVTLLLGLGGYNLFFFGVKTLHTLLTSVLRNPHAAREWIGQHVPPGSMVVGDPLFFYAVVENGSYFQYADRYREVTERVVHQRDTLRCSHLIVTDQFLGKQPAVVQAYLNALALDSVSRFVGTGHPLATWLEQKGLVSPMEKDGYQATLYAVRR
jgi:hypothetical protein